MKRRNRMVEHKDWMECANAEYCLCISNKPTNQPTNQLTNQPTNQRTGVVKYTDACI